MPHTIDLSTFAWTLSGLRHVEASPEQHGPSKVGPIPCTVPGSAHSALIAAGLIGDPRLGLHELEQQWIGETNWTWRSTIELSAAMLAERCIELVIDGLDTQVDVLLNGTLVGSHRSQHVPCRLSLRDAAKVGDNTLELRFEAPLPIIRRRERELGARPVNGDWAPFIFMRKNACNFGWDWGPKVATCGIWGTATIEARSTPRIASLRPLISRRSHDAWAVELHVELNDLDDGRWTFEATLDGGVESATCCTVKFPSPIIASDIARPNATLDLRVQSPALWEPIRMGQAALYALRVKLLDADGTCVDEITRSIGFRTTALKTEADESGRPFTVRINDRDVFCVGVNWIPATLLPGLDAVSPHASPSVPELLSRCEEAQFNMIRVWGGGLYETEAFHDWCDRHGLMVWHDFMFSCAMYPEEAEFTELVREEARTQVTRLSSHASLVLWCGGNECIWGHENWGWKQRLTPGQTWGRGFYFDVLPEAVRSLDPSRPYWPNSPWSGDETTLPNEASRGDRHTWDVRLEAYRTVPSRFCSEFGHQAPSDLQTLREAIAPEDLRVWSPALEHRQRGPGGNAQQYDQVLPEWFSPHRSFEEWHYQAQLLQARAMQLNLEFCRVKAPWCMGSLIWQLNDVWPGLTWSLIDSRGREKLAFRTSLRAARPRHVVITQGDSNEPLAALLNDTDEAWNASVTIERRALDGRLLASCTRNLGAAARGVARTSPLADLVGPLSDPARECYVAHANNVRATWFAQPDTSLAYAPPRASFEAHGEGVRMTAASLIRDLAPFDREVRPINHDGWPLTLLPGESVDLTGPVTAELHRGAWACANWFGLA
jgi:beta-mannosidase